MIPLYIAGVFIVIIYLYKYQQNDSFIFIAGVFLKVCFPELS